ncbi:MAG: prolyl oligopeptidase family serine peptidase [Clostridia bacterium]|nr:prolyl oligopeptidase family serine peptidase [Clostridia bacterium]
MKKLTAFICTLLIIFSAFSISALGAEPYSSGLKVLKTQFKEGEGPETEGISIDYLYFSPAGENDTAKYPLVIWLHGMWDGSYSGRQIKNNGIGYWTSAEFQSRFYGGGAFIMAPRSPEEKLNYWEDNTVYPLRAAIDSFIAENKSNIDVSRIYIGGYSMGGKMTLKMITAYPEMFAAAFPICPAWSPSEENIELFKDIPIWLTCGMNDNAVSYQGVARTWEKIAAGTNQKQQCRFSSMTATVMPDGSPAPSGHESWQAVAHDMFSYEWGAYPNMTTLNAQGEEVNFTYPDGMISWLSQFTSDFDGSVAADSGNITVNDDSNCVKDFFKSLVAGILITFIKISDKISDLF